jgi:ribonucleotide monophosphatase NagD (HAD superfamily)
LRQRAVKQGVEISNFYMIGDTPESDIQGANNKAEDGWISVLVRTGMFNGPENAHDHPARYVCEDLEEAVSLIFMLEGIDRDFSSNKMVLE